MLLRSPLDRTGRPERLDQPQPIARINQRASFSAHHTAQAPGNDQSVRPEGRAQPEVRQGKYATRGRTDIPQSL